MTIRSGLAGLVLAGVLLMTPQDMWAQKRQRDVITREEIQSSAQKELDLFQVIRGMRPHFLEAPKGVRSFGGSMGMAPVAVYVDGKRETGIDALRIIAAQSVNEVRYLDPSRSENQFGITANGGAVLVKLQNAAVAAKDAKPD